jgi:hypothetical protein
MIPDLDDLVGHGFDRILFVKNSILRQRPILDVVFFKLKCHDPSRSMGKGQSKFGVLVWTLSIRIANPAKRQVVEDGPFAARNPRDWCLGVIGFISRQILKPDRGQVICADRDLFGPVSVEGPIRNHQRDWLWRL